MSISAPYPATLEFTGEYQIARWRPLVQWLLVIPHLLIANAIAMTYRYEWRAMSCALFLHEDYPPFDFEVTSEDDRVEPHTRLSITHPEHLNRWKPLYKWLLAVPHYFVIVALTLASFAAVVIGFFAVLISGEYPHGIRTFLVNAYRYTLRVQAYAGLLTDEYPPFRLSA